MNAASESSQNRFTQPMVTRDELLASTLNAVAEIAANEDAPFDVRLGKSLDALDRMLGFRRSALVYQARGTAPILVGHAKDSSDEATFGKDMKNVRAILSSNGEKGVIRSALALRNNIILNDVTQDWRYVPADEYSFSEVCLVETLCGTASLALNVESSTPGVFSASEIGFLTSIADNFAMVFSQNASQLFDLQSTECRARMTLH